MLSGGEHDELVPRTERLRLVVVRLALPIQPVSLRISLSIAPKRNFLYPVILLVLVILQFRVFVLAGYLGKVLTERMIG